MPTIRFEETPEFQKECKRLARKYRSLPKDLEILKRLLTQHPKGFGNHMPTLRQEGDMFIIKARLACESLRGSFLRVIYAYHESLITIFFIELYYKGEKESEDQRRIEEFLLILPSALSHSPAPTRPPHPDRGAPKHRGRRQWETDTAPSPNWRGCSAGGKLPV